MGTQRNLGLRSIYYLVLVLLIVISLFCSNYLPVVKAEKPPKDFEPTSQVQDNAQLPYADGTPDTFAGEIESMQYLASPDMGALASNIIVNGGFEDGIDSPFGWYMDAWNSATASFLWDESQSHSGKKSIKISFTEPNDARWLQTLSVQPYSEYRLSGWIKTSNVAHATEATDAGANLSIYGTWERSQGVFGTTDWTFVSKTFTTGSSTQITIACRLGYWSGTTTGEAWFDDINLELISTPTDSINNPGFEDGVGVNEVTSWSPETVAGSAVFLWDDMTSHSGDKSVRISAAAQSIVRYAQTIQINPDTEYELSGWIKTLGVTDPSGQWWTTGAKIGIYGVDSYLAAATNGLRDTNDWTYVSVRFITGKTHIAKVTCTLGEADPLYARPTSSGTMWCDDLQLIRIRTLNRVRLVGEHVALDMYEEDYQNFDDPVTYLGHLDEVYEAMQFMVKGTPYNGDIINVRSDASMYYGLLSGNPIIIGPSQSWGDIVNQHGIDFGVPHELGHDFDVWPQYRLYMGNYSFDGPEHWANLKVTYAFDILGALYPELTNESYGETVPISQVGQRFVEKEAIPWIESGRSDYWSSSNNAYTGLLYMLRQQVGWEPFINLFKEYGASTIATPATDIEKVQLFANTLSRFAQTNFVPTFQSWGYPIQKNPTFGDVLPGSWYYPYVEGFYYAGITTGCANSPFRYCPDRAVTRAEMAVFILRSLHADALPYTPAPDPEDADVFADVPVATKEWMKPWIEEFYGMGMTTGCATNPFSYCPERQVTRAEMAVFVLRAIHGADYQPPAVTTSSFSDVPVAGKGWMMPWIEQFYAEGLTTGCKQTPTLQYCPEQSVTRAEMATFLDRAFGFPQLP